MVCSADIVDVVAVDHYVAAGECRYVEASDFLAVGEHRLKIALHHRCATGGYGAGHVPRCGNRCVLHGAEVVGVESSS